MAERNVSKGHDARWLLRWTISPGLEVDDQARIVSYEESAPFGLTTYQLQRSGIEAPSIYHFATYLRDHETGLHYCQARYYCPWLGRWMSPDPLDTIDGLNLCCYVSNDPVNWTDPTGTMVTQAVPAQNNVVLKVVPLGIGLNVGGLAPENNEACVKYVKDCCYDCCTGCLASVREDTKAFGTVKNVIGAVVGAGTAYLSVWVIPSGLTTTVGNNIGNSSTGVAICFTVGWFAVGMYAGARKALTGYIDSTAKETQNKINAST
ncbi:hypothetical protein F66182_815 [Fusarium sp. NRRL 66182]|nr:hypothetical protein F66182_815 [Fusarium sp. NRRL 66182]